MINFLIFRKIFRKKVQLDTRRHRRWYRTMPCISVQWNFHYFHGHCGIHYRFSGLGHEWLMLIGFYYPFRQWHRFHPTDASHQPEPFVLQLALHQTVVMGYFDFHFYCTIKNLSLHCHSESQKCTITWCMITLFVSRLANKKHSGWKLLLWQETQKFI